MTNCFQTPSKIKVYQPKPTTVDNHLQEHGNLFLNWAVNYVCKQAVCPKQCAQFVRLPLWKMNLRFGILILPLSAKEP